MKVLVIGGGPAGSTAATAMAQAGLDVQLIESAHFPRYHVGESLTPSCRVVLDVIGVSKILDDYGFVKKNGGVIHWDDDQWTFDWHMQSGVQSWQVDRSEFDTLLLEHARQNGVSVTTGVTGRSVQFADGRPVAVECFRDDGESFTVDDFDFLIDATGRNGLLSARHFGNREPLSNLRNVGVWGYWTGARLLPETPTGGINIISSPEGWYWVIPMAGGRMSIGYVTTKDAFARDRREHPSSDELYRHLVAVSPTVAGLTAGAEFLGGTRVETDYSYIADQFCGPGYAIVGDAACFLDPLLSTGVHLALYSALTAAACVASMDRGEVSETEALRFFEFAYRRAYMRLFALVSIMYERYLGKDGFFLTSDRLIGDEQAGKAEEGVSSRSFAEIIGGLSDLREAAHSSTRVITDQLRVEAVRAQMRSLRAPDSVGPDFTPVRGNPLSDAESADYRLVTSPQLGLERVREARP
ncbi:NAD(P)/FAD-dependent oxidoreductase [Micromonospora matsumotoense]|uniref:NAD(P)/FAD-dependent oxidoreductase n=1 Tax=Micromonospora matsumotoense TaxID=121616 RepID=UPI003D8E6CA5